MKKLLQALPLPIAGLGLGITSLSNLLYPVHPSLKWISLSIGVLILLALTIKKVLWPKEFHAGICHPMVAGVYCCYPMALAVLAVEVKALSVTAGTFLWFLALGIQGVMLAFIWVKFIQNFKLSHVYPTWFIVACGTGIYGVTAKAFGMEVLGGLLTLTGFILYPVIVTLITKRLRTLEPIGEHLRPILCIYTAPPALLLAATLSLPYFKSPLFITLLLVYSQAMYVFALYQMLKSMFQSFTPAFSAFSFPLVISCSSFKLAAAYLGDSLPAFVPSLIQVELLLATFGVYFGVVHFAIHLIKAMRTKHSA